MTDLAVLGVAESVHVDAHRLRDLVSELGEDAARTMIALALEQLARALVHARQAAMDGDRTRLVAMAELLSRLAWQIGLVSLAGVAVDVGACAERGDEVALAATLARLMRVGNRSLGEMWPGAAQPA